VEIDGTFDPPALGTNDGDGVGSGLAVGEIVGAGEIDGANDGYFPVGDGEGTTVSVG